MIALGEMQRRWAKRVGYPILGLVVWSVASRGASQLNLDLITKAPAVNQFTLTPVPQGLANAFVGTFVIVGIATFMALPFGILVAIYVNEFAPRAVKNFLSDVRGQLLQQSSRYFQVAVIRCESQSPLCRNLD